MKKRSEIVKKRSEIVRDASPATGTVVCYACEGTIDRSRITTKRDDGTWECPECGCAIVADDSKKVDMSERADALAPLNPERKWCGTCGSEWPIVNGQFMINCGHMHAARVDDPRKATSFNPPGGLQTRPKMEAAQRDAAERAAARAENVDVNDGPPAASSDEVATKKKNTGRDTSGFTATTQAPKISVDGNRLSVEWGKATFPLGMMQNFAVGSFFASVEHAPGERLKAFREILADFEKMANEAFAKQRAWYLEKLGSLQ